MSCMSKMNIFTVLSDSRALDWRPLKTSYLALANYLILCDPDQYISKSLDSDL